MSLKHTILGFLSYGPQTGYDLKKHMDYSTQAFWHAHLGQIYPTLKKLEKAGLAESLAMPQEGKPDKKYYLITDAGRAELDHWLRQPLTDLPAVKEAALLQLFFSGALEPETIIRQLEAQLVAHRAQLTFYQTDTKAYINEKIAQTGAERPGVMWELLRQFGEMHSEAYIRWLEQAIEVVKELKNEE